MSKSEPISLRYLRDFINRKADECEELGMNLDNVNVSCVVPINTVKLFAFIDQADALWISSGEVLSYEDFAAE